MRLSSGHIIPEISEEEFFNECLPFNKPKNIKEIIKDDDDDIWDNWNPKKRIKVVDKIVDGDYGESDGIDGIMESFD